MKKIYILILAISVMAIGCGEAGFESDVSKTSEVKFDVTVADLNGVNSFAVAESFNFADADFSDYISDAEKFTLNLLAFEVSGLTGATNSELNLEIRIDFNNNTLSSTDGEVLVSLTNVAVANTTSPVLLYSIDSSNPGLANNAVVQAFEQAVLNGAAVEIEVTASKTGPDLTEDFVFTLLFDLTARVQLDN